MIEDEEMSIAILEFLRDAILYKDPIIQIFITGQRGDIPPMLDVPMCRIGVEVVGDEIILGVDWWTSIKRYKLADPDVFNKVTSDVCDRVDQKRRGHFASSGRL
jgi:hypothetical protein